MPDELLVHAEVILEGDGGESLVLALDLDAFLGFHGLVQTVAPAASGHQAAGEFVDDDDLAILDHVVLVALENDVGFEGLLHVMVELDVLRIIKVGNIEELFAAQDAFLGERRRRDAFRRPCSRRWCT